MITGFDTFPDKRSSYKAATSCQKQDVSTLFQLFLEKN